VQRAGEKGAIILAGGDSKRLGVAKPLLKLGEESLIEKAVKNLKPFFNHITVVTDHPEIFPPMPVRFVCDLLTGYAKNPLRGIHAGLSASPLPYQFVLACDMPFINLDLIGYMARFASRYDVVVPCIGSYYQPLHAFYSRSCIEAIRRQLEQNGGKVTSFYHSVRVRQIGADEIIQYDPQQLAFFNINTWDDYRAAKEILASVNG